MEPFRFEQLPNHVQLNEFTSVIIVNNISGLNDLISYSNLQVFAQFPCLRVKTFSLTIIKA